MRSWPGRGPDGKLKGTMSILIMPMGPGALMYAPRGPVCDYDDRDTLADLLAGAGAVAKKYHAHILKMDPYLLEGDKPHIEAFRSLAAPLRPTRASRTPSSRATTICCPI